MKAFLWTFAVIGAINTFAILIWAFSNESLPSVTRVTRFFDAVFTCILTVWAIVLIANQWGQ